MFPTNPQPGPPYVATNNHYFTKLLFLETWRKLKTYDRLFDPVFTYSRPYPGLVDGKQTFIDLGDPTGYKWAMQYLGSWDHFEQLVATEWFGPVFHVWKAELKTKQVSDAVTKINEIAAGESSNALAASKYIAEQGWISKNTRGRPSALELKGELKKAAELAKQHDDDLARIGGLTLIKGSP